jgi:hypothetical protein
MNDHTRYTLIGTGATAYAIICYLAFMLGYHLHPDYEVDMHIENFESTPSVFGIQKVEAPPVPANLTTGSNNTFIGYQAGVSLTTGSDNVAIGKSEDKDSK